LWAIVAVLLFAGWQALTVMRNYGGNWTALFCTGDRLPVPTELAQGTWIFHGSNGYDGQMYRYVAHDPWMGGSIHHFADSVPLRQRRILVPALAWLAAGGFAPWIDYAYLAVIWGCVFAGCYWSARWAAAHGDSPACGLFYLVLPSTLISMDRCTIDVATSSLAVGMIWYWRRTRYLAVWLILMLACLSRETGFILLGACVLAVLAARQWRRAAFFAMAGIPAAAWYWFVQAHAPHVSARGDFTGWIGRGSRFGILIRLFHPVAYSFDEPWAGIAQAGDVLALAGMILAFGLGVWLWWKHKTSVHAITALLFVLSWPAVSSKQFWENAYGYARPFSPLLALLGMNAVETEGQRRRWIWLLPSLMVLPRLLIQLGPQIAGILGFEIHGLHAG
jgi:hypothetical protein